MADLPSSFWGGWITIITVVSMAGLVWLLFSVYFSSKNQDHQEDVVWDENLNEGVNPAPMWWFWLILAAMIFSVIYLMLYPGLGTFKGALKWSQGHRLDQSYVAYQQDYESLRNSILATELATLQQDEFIMNSARGIFDRNCSGCHGPSGEGQAQRFPNLTDADWQWGNSYIQIEQTIRQGRKANMPAWGTVLGDQGISQVIGYIRALGQQPQATLNADSKAIYDQYCIACHGPNGTGNVAIGAPNLTDAVWLYGNSDAELTSTLTHGQAGIMPAFEGRLDDAQIRMLVAWLTR